MVRVVLSGSLRPAVPGTGAIDVQAQTVRQLLQRLGELQPHLRDQLDEGVTVSINGQLYNDAWFEPLPEGAEVYILPRLTGG